VQPPRLAEAERAEAERLVEQLALAGRVKRRHARAGVRGGAADGEGQRAAEAAATMVGQDVDVVDPGRPEAAADEVRPRVAGEVAVDARDGVVAIEGWTEASSVRAEELGRQAADWGAAALLYTDVARDGTGAGPAVESTAALSRAVPVPVIASGGIGSLDHLRALHRAGIAMAVVGRALLEGRFTLAEAREAAC
jgi:phosphoribosylformimino-5-aminoimidazole carboxamide ribotide isomerase